MLAFFTDTTIGQFISTMFISMVPVLELRAGLPYGVGIGLDYPLALLAAVIGNLLPVPFILKFIEHIFAWLRITSTSLNRFIEYLEQKADKKGDKVRKFGPFGLLLLVAVPLPGTGAWTGALIAACLGMKWRDAVPIIMLGVCIAAAIMTAITFGLIHIL